MMWMLMVVAESRRHEGPFHNWFFEILRDLRLNKGSVIFAKLSAATNYLKASHFSLKGEPYGK